MITEQICNYKSKNEILFLNKTDDIIINFMYIYI